MSDLADRARITVALLRSICDYWPFPETWTGAVVRRSTLHGEAPTTETRCQPCAGTGRLRGGWACTHCHGQGVLVVDGYTGRAVATETQHGDQAHRRIRCDSCDGAGAHGNGRQCQRCHGHGSIDAPRLLELANQNGDTTDSDGIDRMLRALEHTATRRIHLPTYRLLIEGMADLARVDPVAARLVQWCFVLEIQDPNTLPMSARWRLMRAVAFLASRLPANPRVPAEVKQAEDARHAAVVAARGRWAAQSVQGERDREIRRRFRQGETIPALSRSFGLSRRRVYQVLEEVAA